MIDRFGIPLKWRDLAVVFVFHHGEEVGSRHLGLGPPCGLLVVLGVNSGTFVGQF